MYKRYLIFLVTLLFLALSGVLVFNLIVDPLDVYRLVKKKGFNEYKSRLTSRTRLARPLQIKNRQPVRLAFGSSRTEIGIPVYGTAWDDMGEIAINAAVSGADITTVKHLFSHAIQTTPVKNVVIGLDFFMFNAVNQRKYPYPELLASDSSKTKRLYHGLLLTLFSPELFGISVKTLRKQRPQDNKYLPTGQVNNVREITKRLGDGYLRGFEKFEVGLTKKGWTECKDNLFVYENKEWNSMASFTQILREAKAKNIDLTLFVSPVHARLLETLDAGGLWEEYETWKRDLVRIMETINNELQGRNVALWDFSGYHDFSVERLPEADGVAMKWFIDSSHYNDDLGRLMLNIMYGEEGYSTDFALKLSSENVVHRNSFIRERQKQYRNEHLVQYKEFKRRAQTLLSEKRENGSDCSSGLF